MRQRSVQDDGAVRRSVPARRRGSTIAAALGLVLSLVLVAIPAGGQQTPGLVETRARVQELTQELSDAETELSALEQATEAAAVRYESLRAEADALAGNVAASAISEFLRSEMPTTALETGSLVASLRAETLADAALGSDTDAMETYRVLFEDLTVARAILADQTAASEAEHAALLAKREELGVELARLEALEAERLAAEARRIAAEQAAARRAAQARAVSSGSRTASGGAPSSVAASGSGVLKACPVAGTVSFVDTWGAARSGGRRHKGVDMMARIGTPIAAPVSGTVTHRSNSVGGRSFHLNGSDGNYYYGTHLSGYEKSGSVQAGDIIGYVGDDGNARGIPHLHFEVHPGGGGAVNPYPYVAAVC